MKSPAPGLAPLFPEDLVSSEVSNREGSPAKQEAVPKTMVLITPHHRGTVALKLSGYCFPLLVESTMIHPALVAANSAICKFKRV